MGTRVHVCAPGDEAPLLAELRRAFPGSSHGVRSRGLVESALAPADDARTPCVAFALQCLPDPEPIAAASISVWAGECARRIAAGLALHAGPWRLHVFCREEPGSDVRGARCARVRAATVEALRKGRRRLARALVAEPTAPWTEGEALVQVVLESPTRGLFSVAPPALRHALRRTISRFEGGAVEVPQDPAPPSRAYRKLLEAEIRLAARIARGETCVDLGAAPGGWTHVALARGARVIAVDRSPLDPALMAHPSLAFVQGDAFKYAPGAPVDWLLSDVIAYPPRIIELLERWIAARLCRRFIVTIKFRGEADYPEIERLAAILEASGAEFELRRMCSNKNEVTAFGEIG
jgi:23S rRNA (cytidine2498-2'-O)-methyltransferase